MSLQIFLHGKIHGVEEFLRADSSDFEARAQWISLLGEILPRAMLAEFGLSAMLLGSSGGGQFLLVLPEEFRGNAEEMCSRVSAALAARSGELLRLVFATTENLGDWTDIRKRLAIALHQRTSAPGVGAQFFDEGPAPPAAFAERFTRGDVAGWSPEDPVTITRGQGKHTWVVGEDLPFADHAAPNDEGTGPASPAVLASRADGLPVWGVLRADVNHFIHRLRRSVSVEEHLQLSLMYGNFITNELRMRCSLPEFWQKVSIVSASGQSFAVAGAWDALIGLAREMHRIFSMFVDSNLREFPGPEGKTISMAIALSSDGATLPMVYADAGDQLEAAKASGHDTISLLGSNLEWKQLNDASESRARMTRLIREFGSSDAFLGELSAFYSDSSDTIVTPGARRLNQRVDKPWRFYRRLNGVLATQGRGREYQRLRTDLISDFTGRRASNIQLRPQGRVALAWARLETGSKQL